jgi:crotonobetainyl-CoA:carnitine CoA-transferase CaiB-like acyl-CoA transferase
VTGNTRPLAGIRVVEWASVGRGPHAAMMLADLGASVIRVERPDAIRLTAEREDDLTLRGRPYVVADLQQTDDRARLRELLGRADVLIEAMRPGKTESLGFGPDACLEDNPDLLYVRLTGWGQRGPWSDRAGHDINYLALSGALHAIGPAEAPTPPLNLVADYAGGAMLAVVTVLAALQTASEGARGRVIDVAMTDGVAILMQGLWAGLAAGSWTDRRASNTLDGGYPCYRTYPCSDGRFMAEVACAAHVRDRRRTGDRGRSYHGNVSCTAAGRDGPAARRGDRTVGLRPRPGELDTGLRHFKPRHVTHTKEISHGHRSEFRRLRRLPARATCTPVG